MFKKLIKNNGFKEVYECLEISFDKYYRENDGNSITEALNSVGKIINIRKSDKKDPMLSKRFYIRAIIKNRFNNSYSDKMLWILLNNYLIDENDYENFSSQAKNSRNWTDFKESILEYYGEV